MRNMQAKVKPIRKTEKNVSSFVKEPWQFCCTAS